MKINVTKTMLEKSICDCNQSVRDYLRTKNIIDYNKLELGERHTFPATLKVRGQKAQDCVVSCYRANGRGDKRIWVTKVRKFAEQGDVLTFSVRKGHLHVKLS